MTTEEEGCLLVVVIDVNPVWWGSSPRKKDKASLTLPQCVDQILVFVNAHLMTSPQNKTAVIGSHANESRFLFPRKTTSHEDQKDVLSQIISLDGKYEQFTKVQTDVMEELKDLISSNTVVSHTDTLLSGSLAMALCYIHKMEKETGVGEKLRSRILVIKAAEDSASQYMNFMNVTFTAQKQNVTIDACILSKDSGLLQQACDITGGIYLKIPEIEGLLQYLLWVYLPPLSQRSNLILPPPIQVDYRAACFCHRMLISVGYVCSVCLSIFCAFSPICSTCHTAFKIKAAPLKLKKKKKMLASGV
ncbi:General transcription factor IIH subunit 3 [Holothuria leucospilota]|uniref:General transcription factor IIH subunit 3 n=1 Tax=Holothuria leucospilota TaxID=206669 RepID=A0A9Q1CGS7_HOLLE|nr:General transcription factor IIH subunit 3 [Holothuria leucospilota]